MSDKKIGGLTLKPDISVGNILVAVSMLIAVVGFGMSLRTDIDYNKAAIDNGILPGAERRITALETQVNIELKNLRQDMADLKHELRALRLVLKRSSIMDGVNGG
tara:strand:- start:308 stop:622 length:315 start_codon:yes stop_codon:yes gene_type:complete